MTFRIRLFQLLILTLLALHLDIIHAAESRNAFGTHGMVLIEADGTLIASHMPLKNSMHAHQIILQLGVPAEQRDQVKRIFSEQKLVSIEPQPFDLHELMSAELTAFEATVYAGHFERGGKPELNNIEFSVEKILLSRPTTNQANGAYYPVQLNDRSALLVHRIGKLPSYDHLLVLSNHSVPKFNDENDTEEGAEVVALTLLEILTGIEQSPELLLRSVYLETEDFVGID